MSIFWFVFWMIVCLFIPSPVSAWGRAQVKKLWNKIFKKESDVGY